MVVIIDHAAIRIAWIGVQEPIWIARIIRIIAVKTWIIRWPASRAITRDDGLERAPILPAANVPVIPPVKGSS